MDIFNYKCINKKVEENKTSIKYIKNLSNRVLITIILFLICSILIKSNNKYKEAIYKNTRCQRSQLKKYFPGYPEKWAGGPDRTFRIGKIFIGFWYNLRRRPTAICRKLIRICSAIFGRDEKTGRWFNRRIISGYFDWTKNDI